MVVLAISQPAGAQIQLQLNFRSFLLREKTTPDNAENLYAFDGCFCNVGAL